MPTDGKYRRICTSWMLLLYLKNLQSSFQLFRPDPECDPSEEDIESADGSPVAAEECPTSRDTHVCRPCLRFSSFTTLTSVALGLIAPLSFLRTTAAWDTTNQQASADQPSNGPIWISSAVGVFHFLIRSSRNEALKTKWQRRKL